MAHASKLPTQKSKIVAVGTRRLLKRLRTLDVRGNFVNLLDSVSY
jgi:hypothetical protein